jgi:hypothetical protein
MIKLLALLVSAGLAMSGSAFGADDAAMTSAGGATGTIEQLLAQGFEIKASVPNGKKFIVFLQKDKVAYACEFASLATSQCGALK